MPLEAFYFFRFEVKQGNGCLERGDEPKREREGVTAGGEEIAGDGELLDYYTHTKISILVSI